MSRYLRLKDSKSNASSNSVNRSQDCQHHKQGMVYLLCRSWSTGTTPVHRDPGVSSAANTASVQYLTWAPCLRIIQCTWAHLTPDGVTNVLDDKARISPARLILKKNTLRLIWKLTMRCPSMCVCTKCAYVDTDNCAFQSLDGFLSFPKMLFYSLGELWPCNISYVWQLHEDYIIHAAECWRQC